MKKMFINALISLLFLLSIWEALVLVLRLPKYIMASPYDVFLKLTSDYAIVLIEHSFITISEILLGYFIGIAMGLGLSLIIIHTKIGNQIRDAIVIIKVIPKIVFVSVILFSFGMGIFPKAIIVALMCFFPIVVDFTYGLSDIENHVLDLCKTYRMKKSEILFKVRLPHALPHIFSGLKIALTLSVTGALAAEWYMAEKGLGHIVWLGGSYYSMDICYASITILCGISLVFYLGVCYLEKKIVFWKNNKNEINI